MPTRLRGPANSVGVADTGGRGRRGAAAWPVACSTTGGTMRFVLLRCLPYARCARRLADRRGGWVRIFVAAAALLAIFACNTPSVPLPPPILGALGFQSGGTGLAVMTGAPETRHANARFYVYNHSRGDGVITTAAADGSFTTSPFAATEGDTAELYYDAPNGEHSGSACVQIRFGVPLLSIGCP
jgi:hypothetical protein